MDLRLNLGPDDVTLPEPLGEVGLVPKKTLNGQPVNGLYVPWPVNGLNPGVHVGPPSY